MEEDQLPVARQHSRPAGQLLPARRVGCPPQPLSRPRRCSSSEELLQRSVSRSATSTPLGEAGGWGFFGGYGIIKSLLRWHPVLRVSLRPSSSCKGNAAVLQKARRPVQMGKDPGCCGGPPRPLSCLRCRPPFSTTRSPFVGCAFSPTQNLSGSLARPARSGARCA